MAKRAELNAVAEVLQLAKVQKALQQADDALESVNNANRFVKGFHSDGKVFDVWERAIQLLKQEQETPITMKALK